MKIDVLILLPCLINCRFCCLLLAHCYFCIQTFGERVYGVMAWIVPVLVACSTFGAANGVAFTGGR